MLRILKCPSGDVGNCCANPRLVVVVVDVVVDKGFVKENGERDFRKVDAER